MKRGNLELNLSDFGKINFDFEWTDSSKTTASFPLSPNKLYFYILI